jgi:hypothetical protein
VSNVPHPPDQEAASPLVVLAHLIASNDGCTDALALCGSDSPPGAVWLRSNAHVICRRHTCRQQQQQPYIVSTVHGSAKL